MNPGAAIARLVVSVSNLGRSRVFYERVLSLTLIREADGFVSLRTGDGVEILLHEREASASDTAVSIGFILRDLDGVVDAWLAQGGVIADPPALQPWGERMALVRDPDGHLVCLSAQS